LIGGAMVVAIPGCHYKSTINRRSIDDLYGEALASAAARPAPIQMGVKVHSDRVVTTPSPQSPISEPSSADPAIVSIAPLTADIDRLPNDRIPDTRGASQWMTDSPAAERIELVVDPIHSAVFKAGKRLPAPATSASWNAADPAPQARMTDVFEQTDIFEVIQILSSHFQVSIIADDSIGGYVTANIEDETLDQILEKILLPLGLNHAKHQERYVIAPPDPGSPLFSYIAKRTSYSPQNHSITALVGLLPNRYRMFIQSSPDRNMAVIEAPEQMLGDIVGRLQELDTPVGQVELEAIVCVVSPDSGFRFGLDWNHVVGVNDAQSLKLGLAGLAMSGSASRQGVQDAFSDFAITSAFMRLLAQEGYITIRAAPRVTSRDGEKASISLNRETFFSLQPDNSNVFFRQDVQKVEAGISLEIVPRIHGDTIAVEIVKAEVSEDIRSSSNADISANPYPIINRRVVSTKVSVRDGHTIVIGGLVQRQTVDRVNRIPGLSGLPMVGKLFQTVEKQEQDVEVAVFISPRIVPQRGDFCSESSGR
jgi:type IV pilus assembly protein PilQ